MFDASAAFAGIKQNSSIGTEAGHETARERDARVLTPLVARLHIRELEHQLDRRLMVLEGDGRDDRVLIVRYAGAGLGILTCGYAAVCRSGQRRILGSRWPERHGVGGVPHGRSR